MLVKRLLVGLKGRFDVLDCLDGLGVGVRSLVGVVQATHEVVEVGCLQEHVDERDVACAVACCHAIVQNVLCLRQLGLLGLDIGLELVDLGLGVVDLVKNVVVLRLGVEVLVVEIINLRKGVFIARLRIRKRRLGLGGGGVVGVCRGTQQSTGAEDGQHRESRRGKGSSCDAVQTHGAQIPSIAEGLFYQARAAHRQGLAM